MKVWHITSASQNWCITKSTFTTEEHNYFNFAESKREAEEDIPNTHTDTDIHETSSTHMQKSTSSTECRVDALALKADEGRGDRRNVPGELHASDEPGESEWGNPSRVMSGDRLLNT